jgi:hypothetical protein
VNPGLVKEGIKIDDIFGAERGIFQAEAARAKNIPSTYQEVAIALGLIRTCRLLAPFPAAIPLRQPAVAPRFQQNLCADYLLHHNPQRRD